MGGHALRLLAQIREVVAQFRPVLGRIAAELHAEEPDGAYCEGDEESLAGEEAPELGAPQGEAIHVGDQRRVYAPPGGAIEGRWARGEKERKSGAVTAASRATCQQKNWRESEGKGRVGKRAADRYTEYVVVGGSGGVVVFVVVADRKRGTHEIAQGREGSWGGRSQNQIGGHPAGDPCLHGRGDRPAVQPMGEPGRARSRQGRARASQDEPMGDPERAKTVVGYLRPTSATRASRAVGAHQRGTPPPPSIARRDA